MAEKTTPRERAAASKSRGDKSRSPTGAGTAAVPKRLDEAEWLSLLRAERGDRDIGDILAELLARVMDGCLQAHVARQRVPFAVGWARDALLRMVQWRFPARDEGETGPEGDGAWSEDEEPGPCTADAWAQGSVPSLRPHPRPDPEEVPSASADLPTPGPSSLDDVAIAPQPHEGKPPLPRPAPLCPAVPPAPCAPPTPAKPPEEGWRLPRLCHGKAEGHGLAGVSSHVLPLPPPSCPGPVTTRPGRPLCSTRAAREGSGTGRGVPRSRPERWIRPQVEVLDPGIKAKPPARPWRSRGPKLGSWLQRPGSPQPPGPLPWQLGSWPGSTRPAPGVTIRWGSWVRRGLCPMAPGGEEEEEEEEEDERDLRPIRPAVPVAGRQVAGDGGC